MLLFFCPSVTWLAFYICNTQKLGLLFKRHREREREGEGERGRQTAVREGRGDKMKQKGKMVQAGRGREQ